MTAKFRVRSSEIIDGVVKMIKTVESLTRNKYDLRTAKWLVENWELNPDDYDIKFDW